MSAFDSPREQYCIVVTRFAKNQPGFLDFSYRIKALGRYYRLTVVSDAQLTQPELQVDTAKYVVLTGGEGQAGWLKYLWNCARLIRQRRPACAVLLHSSVAAVSLATGRVPTALYWNEHPTHLAPEPDRAAPAKRAARAMLRWLTFQGARNATIVMPIGEAHCEDLLAHRCVRQRLRLIYMGVDKAFMQEEPRLMPDDDQLPLELIYIGTVSKARGRDIMLEAVKIANRHTTIAHLTVIGASTEELAFCSDYAQHLGIANAVQLRGRIPGASIPEFLGRADAGLCLWEDQPWCRFNPPTKLFEYLAAGLPVLASDIRTHTQYVSDGHNGLIFNYDSHSLADTIRRLWLRRAELPTFRRNARESGRQYLWEKIEPVFLRTIIDIAHP